MPTSGKTFYLSGLVLFAIFATIFFYFFGRNEEPPKEEIVPVTIPEGYSAAEAAEAFAAKLTFFNKENFLLVAREREGYLFPDTYFFFPRDNEEDALRLMSENYEKKVAPLRPHMEEQNKTEKEIIIMASLIEKEGKGVTERAIISGILWKRLSIGMALQVDAAPITYEKRGLPQRPIANPGLSSIRAAIYPQVSPYLYYLHDKDGNIHYAKNFEEHKTNRIKYLK